LIIASLRLADAGSRRQRGSGAATRQGYCSFWSIARAFALAGSSSTARVRRARVVTPVRPVVGFAETVEDVGRFRVLPRVELEDSDRAGNITHAEQRGA
jgi:hypothetical protein